ncbi:MAG: hypothetical protein AB7I41_08505 [Candidatus Sericytochromatia bacterium]
MSKFSPSGLIEIQSNADVWQAQSRPLPWNHPILSKPLQKTGGLAGLALTLAVLEFKGILAVGVKGLFPGLLGLGAFVLLMGLMRLREQVVALRVDARQIQIWEGPLNERGLARAEAEQTGVTGYSGLSIPREAVALIEIGQAATGRLRSLPVLQLALKGQNEAICIGSGLPEADLNWLKTDLNHWLH